MILKREDFESLFEELTAGRYQILGPTLRDSSIILDKISTVDDLPVGWIEQQEGGKYRLRKADQASLFGYVVGPHTWKKYLYPSDHKLLEFHNNGTVFEAKKQGRKQTRQAFIGIRSCDLNAIAIQDKIFTTGRYVDFDYRQRREKIFIVAINCIRAGETCFCSSMKTGPRVEKGFDLALTEVFQAKKHYFVIESGSAAGAGLLKNLPATKAGEVEIKAADDAVNKAASNMGRRLDLKTIKETLYARYEDPYWEDIAGRCLTCGNCTMVCPTCFCVNIEDVTDLSGRQAERWRRWDSCHSVDFSYIHGGSIRSTAKSRYRQWMMHKLAYWMDQFESPGCVGCGRCITWCPVGIDITEEAGVFGKK